MLLCQFECRALLTCCPVMSKGHAVQGVGMEHRFVPCPGHCCCILSSSCSEISAVKQPRQERGLCRDSGARRAPSPLEFLGSLAGRRCLGFLPVARNSSCTCRVTKANHFCLRWFTLLRVQFQSGIFRAYHMPFINVSVPAQKLAGKRNAASLLRLTRTQALHNLQTAKGTALSLASKGCILTLLHSPSWCKSKKISLSPGF